MAARVKTQWWVTHNCGDRQLHDLSDLPGPKRAGRANWLKERPCTECWKKSRDAGTEPASPPPPVASSAASTSTPATPPPAERRAPEGYVMFRPLPDNLVGTEKQVAWAKKERAQLLAQAWNFARDLQWTTEEFIERVETLALQVTNASTWIEDLRHVSVADVERRLEVLTTGPTGSRGSEPA